MADPWSIVGGSSSSSDPWASVGGGSGSSWADAERKAVKERAKARKRAREAAAKAAAKKDEGRSPLGLAQNLVHDLGDAAMGIPVGLWETAKTVAHDAKDAVDGGGHDFKLDDLGKATWDAVKWTYEPLADGNFKEFGKRVYEHPLGPVLDAFTIVTLGAGGSVKAAKAISDVGRGASLAKTLTGGSVRKLAEGESGIVAREQARLGRARGQKGAGTLSRDGKSILEPAPRLLTSKAQKERDGLSSALSPKAKGERVEGEGVVRMGDYAENPIRRLQQRAYDAISEATGLADRRIAHETRKLERNRARRRAGTHRTPGSVNAAAATLRSKEMRDLSPEVKRAFANQSVVGSADDVAGVAAARLQKLEADAKRVGDAGNAPERQAAMLERVIGRKEGDAALEALAEAYSTLTARAGALNARAATIEERAAGSKISGVVSKPFAPSAKTPDLNEAARLRNAAGIAADNARVLGKAMADPEGTLRDYQQVAKIRQDPLALEQMQATMRVQRALAERGLDADQTKQLNQLLAVLRPVVEGEGGTDALLAETAAMRGVMGPRSKSARGIEDQGFAVTRTSSREYAERGDRQGAANRHHPSRMAKPDASRLTTGYNERFGLDAAEPKNVIATHETVNRFRQSIGMWQEVVDAMRPSGALAGDLPDGYSEVPQGVATRFLRDARAWLDDEAPVIHGEGHPAIDQAREVILEGFAQRFASGPQMVPTKLLKRMEKEMKPQGRLPVIDNLTGLWRTSVVSPLRPAFVVNNIIGQTALLGVAHGALGTLRGMLHYAKYGKDLERYTGAVVGSGQAASLMRETSRLLNNEGKVTGTARNINETLGRISQELTDDPYRRIAFAQEIMPSARRVHERKRGTTVVDAETGAERPYVMRDALEELLADEKVLDRVERKVLDDLVDFDDLNHTERAIVRRILPFYGWIKGSSKMTLRLVQDNPAFANLLYRMGEMGAQQNADLPDYMKGVLFGVPGGEALAKLTGVNRDGMVPGITTAQYNPFVTPGDALQQALTVLRGGNRDGQSAFGPENPLSAASPLVKAAAAALTKKDPFTGQDASWYGVLANSFPQIKGPQEAVKPDGVYGKGARMELAKYLGVPIRGVDLEYAQSLEADPYRQVEARGRTKWIDGKRFIVGNDGRLYMDVGAAKGGG